MGLIEDAKEALRFKDTIFLKSNSDLQYKYNALQILNEQYPNNEKILEELYIAKKGFEGENEIAYQLKKANIGMYVLRDVKYKYQDLRAQIDYVVITPLYIYYIECKNLVGNITVNEKGDFIREITYNGKTYKKGMYSPLRQVEAQRDVIKKIWSENTSKLTKIFGEKNFNKYRRVLVVAANHDTILDTSKAPDSIKYKIIRSDALVRQIEYDYNHKDKNEVLDSQKEMEKLAQSYLNLSYQEEYYYYKFYKEKYCNEEETTKKDDLKERLILLRKNRSSEMKIPSYYVFNNEELDKLLELRPKTIEDLKKSNILTPIKVKTHGELIIKEISK